MTKEEIKEFIDDIVSSAFVEVAEECGFKGEEEELMMHPLDEESVEECVEKLTDILVKYVLNNKKK